VDGVLFRPGNVSAMTKEMGDICTRVENPGRARVGGVDNYGGSRHKGPVLGEKKRSKNKEGKEKEEKGDEKTFSYKKKRKKERKKGELT